MKIVKAFHASGKGTKSNARGFSFGDNDQGAGHATRHADKHAALQEFTCEICGGASYWGRRAFERHFKEWRHQNGMRALGIPNNKNFFEVTQIKDARELWASIQVSPDTFC